MTLSAPDLNTYQTCRRRYHLMRTWRPLRWHPKVLFDACLREAILDLSNGKDKALTVSRAVTRYLETCASPGLATEANPYTLGNDFASMLRTVIEAVSRSPLRVLRPGPVVALKDGLKWACRAFQDESGGLHRWATTESVTGDSVARELHSWHVFGDIAAAQVPMTLHLIAIGRRSGSHQVTPWARIFRHPHMPTTFRFQKEDGSPLGDGWKVVWFQDSTRTSAAEWVNQMDRDNVKLLHDLEVKEPAGEHVRTFRSQVAPIDAVDPFTLLMERPACDVPFPCAFQPVCFGPSNPDMEAFGLYRKVE